MQNHQNNSTSSFNIAVLTTGDELLNGELADTNTGTIAAILSRYGYRLRCSLSVPDQEKEIEAALRYLTQHVQVVVITGGLGSTGDDLTARAAARATGQQLAINEQAMVIRNHDHIETCVNRLHNTSIIILIDLIDRHPIGDNKTSKA